MQGLLSKVRGLTEIKGTVNKRIREFKSIGKRNSHEIFKELCFCILTASHSAERCIHIQQAIDDDFLTLPKKQLAKKLRELGYRFPNKRAEYIVGARRYKDTLKKTINPLDDFEVREWLVKNVKGIGYKEASHFLRNIGYENLAILDFHIIDVLAKNDLVKKPATLTKSRYLETEELLRGIAKKLGLSLAELDLYLWYLETGKVLK